MDNNREFAFMSLEITHMVNMGTLIIEKKVNSSIHVSGFQEWQ